MTLHLVFGPKVAQSRLTNDAGHPANPVDLRQFLVAEGKIVERCDAVDDLLRAAGAGQDRSHARARKIHASAICASDWPRRRATPLKGADLRLELRRDAFGVDRAVALVHRVRESGGTPLM